LFLTNMHFAVLLLLLLLLLLLCIASEPVRVWHA
jgi:hypothetical protein